MRTVCDIVEDSGQKLLPTLQYEFILDSSPISAQQVFSSLIEEVTWNFEGADDDVEAMSVAIREELSDGNVRDWLTLHDWWFPSARQSRQSAAVAVEAVEEDEDLANVAWSRVRQDDQLGSAFTQVGEEVVKEAAARSMAEVAPRLCAMVQSAAAGDAAA